MLINDLKKLGERTKKLKRQETLGIIPNRMRQKR